MVKKLKRAVAHAVLLPIYALLVVHFIVLSPVLLLVWAIDTTSEED